MKIRALFTSAIFLAAACGAETVSNTPQTDAVLDLLSPRFRFGETLGDLKRGGTVIEIDSSETGSASARLALPSERLGFAGLRIIGPKIEDANTGGDIKAHEFIFYTDQSRNGFAEQEAMRALTRVFQRPPATGCAGSAATREERLSYWENPSGGGAALFVPVGHAGGDLRAWPVRLVVYPEPRQISEIASQYRPEPCDAAT